ncbi:TPA: hypothetical protein ACY3HR_004613 [Citrobacter freundii]|uniref:hypothetical protein n=1 Tax=Citrobacter freundii complex TaxID=1344959 RepID=UPI003C6C759D
MTTNKLTDEQLQEIYGEAVSCELAEKNGAYMASFDLLCKMDDVGGTAHVVRKLIDMLRAERVELQERRKADSAEPVAYWRYAFRADGFCYADGINSKKHHDAHPLSQLSDGDYWRVTPLYTAPPAPVVPDEKPMPNPLKMYAVDAVAAIAEVRGWNACRAAMLQAGNSPVIPNGYVLVPIVPTEDMIINGFESVPDPHFSDEKEWEEYEALSGCRQAARRAELCWAAMIKAAPKQENI